MPRGPHRPESSRRARSIPSRPEIDPPPRHPPARRQRPPANAAAAACRFASANESAEAVSPRSAGRRLRTRVPPRWSSHSPRECRTGRPAGRWPAADRAAARRARCAAGPVALRRRFRFGRERRAPPGTTMTPGPPPPHWRYSTGRVPSAEASSPGVQIRHGALVPLCRRLQRTQWNGQVQSSEHTAG